MKTRKNLFTGIAAISLLGVAAPIAASEATTSVQAATTQKLSKKAYIYNVYGKKTKKMPLAKGITIKVLSTKKIKGNKYYRIGKNKYIKFNCVAKEATSTAGENQVTPPSTPWTSQHLVDNKGWSLTEQMYKAEEMTGDQRQNAENEIAAELNMYYVKQLKTSNNSKDMQEEMLQFHNAILEQLKAKQDTENWIEQGR